MEEKKKVALITGITGQDGSFLAEFLLQKGYEVHGIIRRSSSFNTGRIDHLYHDRHEKGLPFYLHYGDLLDSSVLRNILLRTKPDEVYNLGAQSHVKVSFEQPEYTVNVTALGTLRLLDAIRDTEQTLGKQIKFYQASSSEMYGKVKEIPQKETTPFHPRSPYGCAKVFAFWQTVNYREAYGMHCSNGILFNHESERRGETFVTRKITRAATRIIMGLQESLYLGNLNAKRDWGYAKDYVEAMWLMLQQEYPDDYVIATGKSYSVRYFVEKAFEYLGIKIRWEGKGVEEKGIIEKIEEKNYKIYNKNLKEGKPIIFIDPAYFRPAEVEYLLGDYSKAKEKLGWRPKTTLSEIIKIMIESDLQLAKDEYKIKYYKL